MITYRYVVGTPGISRSYSPRKFYKPGGGVFHFDIKLMDDYVIGRKED